MILRRAGLTASAGLSCYTLVLHLVTKKNRLIITNISKTTKVFFSASSLVNELDTQYNDHSSCMYIQHRITIALARLFGAVTSVMMAKLMLMLPLLIPPMTRAITNTVKLCDNTQSAYDTAIPTCHSNDDYTSLHIPHIVNLIRFSQFQFPLKT